MVTFAVSSKCVQAVGNDPVLPDHQEAARLCWALSGGGWQATLRHVRELRDEAETMIETLWPELGMLAGELIRRGELDHAEVAAILGVSGPFTAAAESASGA